MRCNGRRGQLKKEGDALRKGRWMLILYAPDSRRRAFCFGVRELCYSNRVVWEDVSCQKIRDLIRVGRVRRVDGDRVILGCQVGAADLAMICCG